MVEVKRTTAVLGGRVMEGTLVQGVTPRQKRVEDGKVVEKPGNLFVCDEVEIPIPLSVPWGPDLIPKSGRYGNG